MPELHLVFNGWRDKVPIAMTLEELRDQIREQAPMVGKAPYSHNIIGLALRAIDKDYGRAEANKAIDDFKLRRKGWDYQPCEHCGHWPCGCGG